MKGQGYKGFNYFQCILKREKLVVNLANLGYYLKRQEPTAKTFCSRRILRFVSTGLSTFMIDTSKV